MLLFGDFDLATSSAHLSVVVSSFLVVAIGAVSDSSISRLSLQIAVLGGLILGPCAKNLLGRGIHLAHSK